MTKRRKRIPQRTCVGCRQVLPKSSLMRLVRTPDGVKVDSTGKAHGRGAYLHQKQSCWEQGLKGSIAHALRIKLAERDKEYLKGFITNLPE